MVHLFISVQFVMGLPVGFESHRINVWNIFLHLTSFLVNPPRPNVTPSPEKKSFNKAVVRETTGYYGLNKALFFGWYVGGGVG